MGQASRLPSAGRARGHAASAGAPSESKLSSAPSTEAAARLGCAGGLHPSEAVPPTFCVIAPIPDLCYGPRYAARFSKRCRERMPGTPT